MRMLSMYKTWLSCALIAGTFSLGCIDTAPERALDVSDGSVMVPTLELSDGSTSAPASDAFADGGSVVPIATERDAAPAPALADPMFGADGGKLAQPSPDAGGRAGVGAPTVSSVIASVAFEQSKAQSPIPVLLFEGGFASFEVEQLVTPIDIAYDLIERPTAWPAWRRGAAGVELSRGGAWTPVLYKYECAPLPAGTTLAGLFERRASSVVGNQAAVQTVTRYRFGTDGSFAACEMKKTAIVALGSITTERTESRGTYQIDGYKVRLINEDASSVTQPFFYDPARPTRMWLGRLHYPASTGTDTALCVAP
jgi:hypothetical protein